MSGMERVVFGELFTSSNPITSIKPKQCHEFEFKFNSLKKKKNFVFTKPWNCNSNFIVAS